jgi:hypothetical protein
MSYCCRIALNLVEASTRVIGLIRAHPKGITVGSIDGVEITCGMELDTGGSG